MTNNADSQQIEITTDDGWVLKANLFENRTTGATKSIIVILPAMGAHARPYRFMAAYLADQGHTVLTVDPRGHGQSLPHPKRGIDYGVDDFLREDIPAVLNYMRENYPDIPVCMIGHSFGGHLSAIYAAENPDEVDAVITLTTTHLHFKKLAPPSLLLFTTFSIVAKVLGCFPGQHVGWGWPMAHQQVMGWARWGFNDCFVGTDGRNLEPAMAKLEKPLLSIGFSDDKRLARPPGIDHFNDLLPECDLTRWILTPEDLGLPEVGHFGHLRGGEKLWAKIDDWVKAAVN